MGDLDKVAGLQIDYRGLLGRKPGAGGATMEEEYFQKIEEKYSPDQLSNMAVALHQITDDPDEQSVLMEAIALLDHLDTLGMEVRFKQ